MGRALTSTKAKLATRRTAAAQSTKKKPPTARALATSLAAVKAQQRAISEILRVMAASPSDVLPVLDAVARHSARLCDAPFARILLVDGDVLRHAADYSIRGRRVADPARPVPLRRTSILGRAALDRRTIHITDLVPLLDSEYPDARANAHLAGFRTILAVPLMREGSAFGGILVYRRVVRRFTRDQVALVETFARQAAIAIDNVRLFRETGDALDQQTATAEILQVISSSPGNLQPVLETVVRAAARFCGATDVLVLRLRDGVLHGSAGIGAYADTVRARLGSVEALEIAATRDSVSGRCVVDCRTVHIHDLAAEREDDYPVGRELQRRLGHRSVVATPLLREGVPLGVIALFRMEVNPFSERQIQLLRVFADQAVIAIENVRMFTELGERNRDLSEALEQQTATSEILRVISGSQTNVQPVFDAIAVAALKLCRASAGNVTTFDGELVHMVAIAHVDPRAADELRRPYPMPPGRATASTRAIESGEVVAIPDVLADAEHLTKTAAFDAGFRSILSVPMIRDEKPIGAINVGRSEPGLFSDKQVAVLRTFADQAVIAIENVRLFTELEARNRDISEALEQQTATSDILRVISGSPTDAQPVFDIIGERAEKLCDAEFSVVSTFDGETIRLEALHGMVPAGREALTNMFPMSPTAETVTARTVRTREIVHVADALADPLYGFKDVALTVNYRSCLGVPMLRDGQVVGVIFVARSPPGSFSDTQVDLLKTFSDQAVIAIENVRLFKELDARNLDLTIALDQQTATSEILRVISGSQTNVQPVFDAIVKSAVALCGAEHSLIFRFDGEILTPVSRYEVTQGLNDYWIQHPMRPGRGSVSGRATLDRRTVHVHDVLSEPGYEHLDAQTLQSYRTVLSVPMLRDGAVVGVITSWRNKVDPFSEKEIELVETFADQAAIAIENVRLFTELEARTRQLTRSVGELKALGEVGQAVSSTLDLETVLSTIVTRATQLAGMDAGAIYEYDEQREEFFLHAADKFSDELVEAVRATPIRKGEGALGRLAVTREPVQISDIADAGVYQSHIRDILLQQGYRSLLAVPLLREDRLLGGLSVICKRAGEFAPEVVALLQTFASQSALAIQNARLFHELEEKGKQLETASRHKSEFLANMSHELRTPLNAIIGFSEVLSEKLFGEINAKQEEYVADILESGRHLLDLINDILDLSKIEAGRMELELADFQLSKAVENALTLVRERASRHGIKLDQALDGQIGTVRADERKVKQVLLNLLSNALKFTPEGGHVEVRVAARDGMAEIAVTDTGVGIAPEDQETVFEEFRQVGSSAKKREGTGLGLAISRKFIELHGGRIWVESQLGKGSTFAFTLPLKSNRPPVVH